MFPKNSLSESELTMHKLMGEHQWRGMASYNNPYLRQCDICGKVETTPYDFDNSYTTTSGSTNGQNSSYITLSSLRRAVSILSL